MSDTRGMAREDLAKLVPTLRVLDEIVADDECTAIFVLKSNGELGVVSSVPTSMILAAMMTWVGARLIEMGPSLSGHLQVVEPPPPSKNKA